MCAKFSRPEAEAVVAFLKGMGLDRSKGLRALALMAVEQARGDVGGSRPRREERSAEGESRVAVPPVPQTVFVAGPPMPDPEVAE